MRRSNLAALLISLLSFSALSNSGSRWVMTAPGVIEHGSRKLKEIALTFDACSEPRRGVIDTAVVNVLRETRTPATIFAGGKWARDVAPALRALAADTLFEIGCHAYMHPHLLKLSSVQVRKELGRGKRALADITGRPPRLFRAPYGEIDGRVARIADSLGFIPVEYDLPSGDPDTSISSARLVKYVVGMARRGSIVVMHINGRGRRTAEALPGVIAGLRGKGYTLVTVGRLIAGHAAPSSLTGPARAASQYPSGRAPTLPRNDTKRYVK
ncbi:MAG TPA: polysaccharide deacetylase family protein [Bacteroidota bacterium]|nr:polysaccharide deacetylase family protein [Bacteroidota bacterium]